MASNPQLAVGNADILQNNYPAVIFLTAIVYDYILTFPKEIEYIWNRPWTRVSTLFILARYLGLCSTIILPLVGTTFLPGSAKAMYLPSLARGLASSSVVLIIRVWALYNRSRSVLGVLLVFFTIEAVVNFLYRVVLTVHNKPIAVSVQVADLSFCEMHPIPFIFSGAVDAAQLVLASSICLLITRRLIKQSLPIYRVTKQFRPNRYATLFMVEGAGYFLVTLTFAFLNVLYYAAGLPAVRWRILIFVIPQTVPSFTLGPRTMLSLREMYARDVQVSHGSDTDTVLGSTPDSRYGGAVSAIVFADVGLDGGAGSQRSAEVGCQDKDVRVSLDGSAMEMARIVTTSR